MPLTVRRLIGTRRLGLSLVAGRAGLDRVITWAHAIELPDPSPWLSGGELVMTTGLHLPESDHERYEYVRRIVESGSAALAFDVGMHFDRVPSAVCVAGDELGLPVLAVATATPFIAISRAVIDELTLDQVRLVQQVVQGQETLARMTMQGGVQSLIKTLSTALDCSTCVVDRSGLVLAESGADADGLVGWVHQQLDRDQGRRRGTSRAFVDARGTRTIQQLPGAGDGPGYLAVASAQPLGPTERLLVGHTIALLSIELAKPVRVIDAEQRLRVSVTHALLQTGIDIDAGLLHYFGFAADAVVAVAAFTELGPLPPAERQLSAAFDDGAVPFLMTNLADDDGIAIVVHVDGADALIDRVYTRVRGALRRSINGGIGAPAPIHNANLSLQQALSAVRVGEVSGHKLIRFEELGTFSLLLSTQSDDVLRAIADRWLRDVENYDQTHGTKLLRSLESFLHHNGHWDATAAELRVHRHTLRKRMDRVVELIGRDIDSAHTRSELWIALKAKELLALESGSS